MSSKVAVVGAGAVGSAVAYALLMREVARDVVLYDIDGPRVEAEVLDLAHGTLFMGHGRITGGTDPEVMRGANVVVITAGAKQRPGQTRMELAATNVKILRSILPTVLKVWPSEFSASAPRFTRPPGGSSRLRRPHGDQSLRRAGHRCHQDHWPASQPHLLLR